MIIGFDSKNATDISADQNPLRRLSSVGNVVFEGRKGMYSGLMVVIVVSTYLNHIPIPCASSE